MKKPDHSIRGHAPFSPSQIKYLANCSGYHGAEGENEAAAMGTRIHEALEIRDPSILHNEDEVTLYDICVEVEELLLAGTGIDSSDFEHHHEIQLDIQLEGTATWGTCDRLAIFPCGTQACMIDYKTGIVPVEHPEHNWQAKAYVVGAFQRFPSLLQIHFSFIIPQQDDKCPTHTFSRADLPTLVRDISNVIRAAEKIRCKWDNGTPELEEITPSTYCRFCRHEEKCPALGGLVLSVYHKLSPNIQVKDVDFEKTEDPETVEKLYLVAKIVEAWSERLRSRAVEMAKAGVVFPTLRLKSLGAPSSCTDNNYLVRIAGEFGITPEEAVELASISLGKMADLAATKSNDKKTVTKQKFLDTLNDAGIIEKGATRFTLS